MSREFVLRGIKRYRWVSPGRCSDNTVSHPGAWNRMLTPQWGWSRGRVVAHGQKWVWHNVEEPEDPIPWVLEAVKDGG